MDFLDINSLGSSLTYGLSSGINLTTELTYGVGSTIGYGLNSGLTMTSEFGSGIGSMIGLGYTSEQSGNDNEYYHDEISKKKYVKKNTAITYGGIRATELGSTDNLNNLSKK